MLAVPLIGTAPARAFVYWGGGQSPTIGRADNDGSHVEGAFIHTGSDPFAVAVDSSHIYWANQGDNSIGRANIDGTEVNNSFITGISEPSGVAVNSTSIYWSSFAGDIGRAAIDGSHKEPNLIPTEACGIALDSGHVYWGSLFLSTNYIGRAPLSGTPPNYEFVAIPGVSAPCGVAVNAANIFWANYGLGGGTEIGRAGAVSGMFPDPSAIGDAAGPCGVAVDSSHLYWANSKNGTIGRANTDTTNDDESFIATGGSEICGVAVDSLSSPLPAPAPTPKPTPTPPSNSFSFGKLKRNLKRGTATIGVTVAGPGTLAAGGKGVVKTSVRATGAGAVKLTLKAAGAAKRELSETGKEKIGVSFTFSPSGGTPLSKAKSVVLKEKLT